MSVTAPDWLTQRNGGLRLAPDGRTYLFLLNDTPQYKLTPTPADGKLSCLMDCSFPYQVLPCCTTAMKSEWVTTSIWAIEMASGLRFNGVPIEMPGSLMQILKVCISRSFQHRNITTKQ